MELKRILRGITAIAPVSRSEGPVRRIKMVSLGNLLLAAMAETGQRLRF